jgi:glucosamine--fructose-6-phosphate aminotransferase (isomerizing)
VEKIPYGRAIPLQPAFLDKGRDTLRKAMAPLSRRAHRQQVVGIIGIGASYCAALAAEYLFRSLGVRSIAIDAGQLYAGDVHGLADAYIGISASGQSVETVAALGKARDDPGTLLVGVTGEPSSMMGTVVDFEISCGITEDSVPATTSYVASLQALALLAAVWAGAEVDATAACWSAVPAVLTEHIERMEDAVKAPAGNLAAVASVDLVGDAASVSAAAEGSLLFREATRIPAAWFDSRSYLHGPMEALQEGRAVLVLGDAAEAGNSVILAQAAAIGCPSVAITHNPPANDVPHLALPPLAGPLVASVFQIVTLQLLTLRCSELLGLTSGKFRYPQPHVKLAPPS